MNFQKFNLPVQFSQEAIGDFSLPKVRSKPRKRKMWNVKKKCGARERQMKSLEGC